MRTPANRDCARAASGADRHFITSLCPSSYEGAAFRDGRARMFADLRAVFGSSPDAIAELGTRYGATQLWVRRDAVPRGARWRAGQLPYGRYVHGLLRRGEPASLRLPAACRTWRHGPVEIYAIACVARSQDVLDSETRR